MIVLDSNALVEILDGSFSRGEKSMWQLLESEEKVAWGLEKRGKSVREVASFPSLPFDREAALLSAKIEAGLEKASEPVRQADTMIAAVTVRAGARLHTYNLRHFERMKRFGLRLVL